jgi:N,N'-diacetyllegionaminate synthase
MKFSKGRCLVIAEAGVNHNGSLELALQLASAAKESGADFVKYQTFVPSLVASDTAPVAGYQLKTGFSGQQAMLSNFVLSDDEHQLLKKHCDQIGIGFSSTGHDLESANYLENLGQDFVKVGSGDLTNWQLLETVAAFEKTLLVSTGASSWDDVVAMVKFLEGLEFSIDDHLILLQCTSAYPAPPEEANVRVLSRYHEEFGCKVGYSDHTQSTEAALAAVALGAVVIEKHLTLDTYMEGPDHSSSLDPEGFTEYVSSIRRVESALGTDEKRVTPSEVGNQSLIRKGLYARTAIAAGAEFTSENVIAKRPVSSVPASMWPQIKGQPATRTYEPDEPLGVTP